MYLGKVKAGEVWRTSGRKGNLTLMMMEDVDFSKDGFFKAAIAEGTAKFISAEYNLAQRLDGLGTQGTVMDFRTTLTTLHERVSEPSKAEAR